ncbi:MAG: hypothetical protein LBL13_08710 [Bacteroidales bacterium]|jgi:hypothetical protein|nr:hypothetical protein [Bacteroidales bacterium]
MEKRDITGKKYYKELSIKPVKRNMEHYCFIAVRTGKEPLEFFSTIFQQTNYLFQLSKSVLEMVARTDYFSFRSFEFQDTLSDNLAFCIVNKSTHQEQYLFGKDEKNACFVLHPKYWKSGRNQLSLPFSDMESDSEDEKNDWDLFKTDMGQFSTNLTKNIDYLFPVEIHTYEILKPLFLYFSKMKFLNYTLINPKDVTDIDSFFPHWFAHVEQSGKVMDIPF